MIRLELGEIARLAPGRLDAAGDVAAVDGVSIDSRTVEPGDLFVAVGRGAEFVDEARARGAAATLVPDDAFAAFAALGRAVRDRSSARVVAITGSVGKTTTKDILGALCAAHVPTVVAEGSRNNEIGLPLTLCRIEPETEIVVVEMGMRGIGQIAELCAIARPQIGVVTSVGPVHLELLGTVERVAQTKAEVVTTLPPGGTAVVPADEPLLVPYLRDDVRTIGFGPGGEVRLVSFEATADGAQLTVDVEEERVELEFAFGARHAAANALAALGAYWALGLPLDRAYVGARAARLSPWRGEEAPLPGDGLLINDAYNANPISMAAALEHLVDRAGPRRRVAVLGDMAELGPDAPAYHREVGTAAERAGVSVLVAVGELARGYLAGAPAIGETRWAANAESGLAALREVLEPGDCVLVKGSRSVGLEAVAEALAVVAA